MPVTNATLRPARIGDVEAVATLWHDGWRDGHAGRVPGRLVPDRTLATFRRRVPPRLPQTTIATIGRRVVGFVTVRGDEVEQLYVAGAARGTGVAATLLGHGEQAVARAHTVAWLAVVPGNARARRFYERNGWRDAGPFDNPAEIPGDSLPVPCRRYEKRVAGDDGRRAIHIRPAPSTR